MISREDAKRRRAFHRASYAWQAGEPHRAWEILAESGFEEHAPEFFRQAHGQARRRFVVRMTTA